MNSNI